jgi:branched-chain amino acid transport system substrate-binding protein
MIAMRRSPPLLSVLGIVAGTLSVVACGGGGGAEALRLGLAAPLEESYGQNVRRGAALAVERLNSGGAIEGRRLLLEAVSDSADPQRAVVVAERFHSDESTVAVIGHVNSGTTLAAAPIYDRGLPAVSPTATSPEVSGAGPWVFRIASSDKVNSATLADFALRELGSRAVILYANEPYGRGLREGFGQAFRAGGGTLLEEYPYIEGQTTDFEAYLLGTRAASPDLIFIAGLDAGAALIIRQARALGIGVPILGGDGIIGIAGQGDVYDGTYVGLLYHRDAPGAGGRQFVEAYRAQHGEEPDHFAALGYDAVMLVAQAITAAGSDRERIRDYLAQVGGEEAAVQGVSGLIAFDSNGDPVEKRYAIGRISGGNIELVSVEGGT